MPFETFFAGRLKVKVTGVKIRSKWSNNLYICAWASKIILHSCCPRGGEVPFETFFFQVG